MNHTGHIVVLALGHGRSLGVAASALGFVASVLMYFGTWGMEPAAGAVMNSPQVTAHNEKVAAHNRRRVLVQRTGLVLLAISFGIGGYAPFLPP